MTSTKFFAIAATVFALLACFFTTIAMLEIKDLRSAFANGHVTPYVVGGKDETHVVEFGCRYEFEVEADPNLSWYRRIFE